MVANQNKPKPNHLGKYFTFGEHTFGTPPRSGFKEALRQNIHKTYIEGSVRKSRQKVFFRFAFVAGMPFMLVAGLLLGFFLFPIDTATIENSNPTYKLGAVVSYVDGKVQALQENGAWTEVVSGSSIRNYDKLRTTDDGRAVLTFFDGSSIRLSSNSQIGLRSVTNEEIELESLGGEMYARVSENGSRFKIYSSGVSYTSLGTAYRIINTVEKQGVEVYHNEVRVSGTGIDKEVIVREGNSLYTIDRSNPELEMKVIAVSGESLEGNSFIQWNRQQDINTSKEYGLGVLANITKLSYANAKTGDGQTIEINWGISGLTNNLQKTVLFVNRVERGAQTQTYNISNLKEDNSFSVPVENQGVYTVKLCVSDGQDICSITSDLLVVDVERTQTDTINPLDKPIQLSSEQKNGSTLLKWSVGDSLEVKDGFRLVMSSTNSEPIHGVDTGKYIGDGNSRQMNLNINDSKSYYVRICRYISSSDSCDSYSNVIVVAQTSDDVGEIQQEGL
jgi:hypothetical protein